MQHFEAFEKDIEEEVLGSIRKLAEMQCIKHHKAHHAWVDMIRSVEMNFDVSFILFVFIFWSKKILHKKIVFFFSKIMFSFSLYLENFFSIVFECSPCFLPS